MRKMPAKNYLDLATENVSQFTPAIPHRMQPDILEFIKNHWAHESADIVARLNAIGPDINCQSNDRVLRAILFLATQCPLTIDQAIHMAISDYRDVLWQAEYDPPDHRKYDFEKSFPENGVL